MKLDQPAPSTLISGRNKIKKIDTIRFVVDHRSMAAKKRAVIHQKKLKFPVRQLALK